MKIFSHGSAVGLRLTHAPVDALAGLLVHPHPSRRSRMTGMSAEDSPYRCRWISARRSRVAAALGAGATCADASHGRSLFCATSRPCSRHPDGPGSLVPDPAQPSRSAQHRGDHPVPSPGRLASSAHLITPASPPLTGRNPQLADRHPARPLTVREPILNRPPQYVGHPARTRSPDVGGGQ